MSTTLYKASKREIQKCLNQTNLILSTAFRLHGWDALNFDNRSSNLANSRVVDNNLYLCITDGHPVEIDEDSVDPEYLLDEYDISELEGLIKPASQNIIRLNISRYEMNIDIDECAQYLIDNNLATFTEIVKIARKLKLV